MRARTMLSISLCSIVRWWDDEIVMAILSLGGTDNDELPAKVVSGIVSLRGGRVKVSFSMGVTEVLHRL